MSVNLPHVTRVRAFLRIPRLGVPGDDTERFGSRWGSHRAGDANDERRRLAPGLFVFLLFSCLYKAVTLPGAWRLTPPLSVESIDSCGIAPSLRSAW